MQFPHLKLPKVLGGNKAQHDAPNAAAKPTNNDDEQTTSIKSTDVESKALNDNVDKSLLTNEDSAPILALLVDELSKDDAHEVASALHNLSKFTHHEKTDHFEDNRKAIFQNGGHLAIIQAMKRFVDSPELQFYGLGVIKLLTSDRTGQNKMLIAQIGGIETIIKSMNTHPADAAVQHRGCAALANLIKGSEAHGIRLDQAGGLKAIVAAMKAFPQDALVQFYALLALESLLQWEECEAHLLVERGASAIAAALENHGADTDVSHVARKLCGHLATSKVIAKAEPVLSPIEDPESEGAVSSLTD